MPGASPTISTRASRSPNERTGAFFQSGYWPVSSCRNATSLGQRGQSSDGSSKRCAATGAVGLGRPHQRFGWRIVELAVLVALGELRGHGRARRALRRAARDQRRQLGKLDEVVGLTAQLVGYHRRRGLDGANDRDAQSAALHGLDQAAEIAVAREQDHVVEVLGHLEHVYGKLDVHVALDLAAAHGVGEFLGRLGDHGVAVVVQPIDQRADRRVFLILDQRRVVVGADQPAFLTKDLEQAAVVDVEAQRAGRGIEVGAVDEESDTLVFVKIAFHGGYPFREYAQRERKKYVTAEAR